MKTAAATQPEHAAKSRTTASAISRVERALASWSGGAERVAPGRWLPGTGPAWAIASADRGWLTVTVTRNDRDGAPAGSALSGFGALVAGPARAAGVKPAIDPRTGVPCLLGELSLDVEDDSLLGARVDDLLADLASVLGSEPHETLPIARGGELDPPDHPALRELCDAAGWPTEDRGSGIRVRLDTARTVASARLAFEARHFRGGSRAQLVARAEIGLCDAPPDSVRRTALARLLLTVAGSVRLIRATAEESGEGPVLLRLESVAPRDACAADLDRALGALSVGADLCAPEVALITARDDLSSAFLRVTSAVPHSTSIPNA